MLRLEDIHTYYGDSHVLQGVSLEVPAGSIVALLGRNGMGKTTTINSIIGFNPPARGDIVFKGVNITGRPADQIARMGMALVPQGRRIFRSLTVKENLLMGWRSGQGHRAEIGLEEIYGMFPVLKLRSRHLGGNLSGGEQQMLAIGRALMTRPDFILLDEPLEGLAPAIVQDLARRISRLKEAGRSILLVEQNIPLALRIADSAYIISKGKIVYQGTAAQLQAEEDIKRKYLTI